MGTKWSRISNEQSLALALECNSRDEFRKKHPSAYNRARQYGFLDQACAHMIPIGNKYFRCLYEISLDNSIYIGLTMEPTVRWNGHKSRGTKEVKALIEKGAVMNVISDFLPKDEASKKESELMNHYRSLGFKLLNKKAGGGLGGRELIWTEEKVRAEALRYPSRKKFICGSHGAYAAAVTLGILEDVCQHMPLLRSRPWTEQQLREEAARYNELSEFRQSLAYHALIRNKDLYTELTGHMTKERKRWTDEELWAEWEKHGIKLYKENEKAYAVAKGRGLLAKFRAQANT